MAELFTMSTKEFLKLEAFFKRSPKQFMIAAKGVLNTFAFGTREELTNEINNSMTVRSSGFIKSSVKVEKARGSNLNSMFSVVGSIRRKGFSGWIEQETGKKSNLNRTITAFARGGSFRNKVRSRNRLKPSNQFFDPDKKFSGKSYEHRVAKMLGAMRTGRAVKKQPFVIRKKSRGKIGQLKKGTHSWKGKQTGRLQNYEKKTQPKRNQIMKRARQKRMSSINIGSIWMKELNRIVNSFKSF